MRLSFARLKGFRLVRAASSMSRRRELAAISAECSKAAIHGCAFTHGQLERLAERQQHVASQELPARFHPR
jgi:hypothetical protein